MRKAFGFPFRFDGFLSTLPEGIGSMTSATTIRRAFLGLHIKKRQFRGYSGKYREQSGKNGCRQEEEADLFAKDHHPMREDNGFLSLSHILKIRL